MIHVSFGRGFPETLGWQVLEYYHPGPMETNKDFRTSNKGSFHFKYSLSQNQQWITQDKCNLNDT